VDVVNGKGEDYGCDCAAPVVEEDLNGRHILHRTRVFGRGILYFCCSLGYRFVMVTVTFYMLISCPQASSAVKSDGKGHNMLAVIAG
jgi:hypothetical protein